MKKTFKKVERRRPVSLRKNVVTKPTTGQPSSGGPNNAPRRLKNKLYICGLLPTVLREELIREFGKYGKLHDVWVAKKPPGFAFIEYINSRDAERVVHELDDAKVLGSKVRIEFAKANKGPEDGKRPKRLMSLSSTSGSGNKLLNANKPTITPLMGQIVVPSLLSASIGSLSLLGSPPLANLALSNATVAGTPGPSFRKNRSPRGSKRRYRAESGGRGETALSRKVMSPQPRRCSRSSDNRGRMMSPLRRGLVMPSPPSFSRLSRNDQRSIPPLLPPPPSRVINANSISKLPRLLRMSRLSRSPIRIRSGSLGRMRSLSRIRGRSPVKSWARGGPYFASPTRVSISENRMRESISPIRNRSWGQNRKRSLSHGKERSLSPKRGFVKSQVKSVRSSRRSPSLTPKSSYDSKRPMRQSLLRDSGGRSNFKKDSCGLSPSPVTQKRFERSHSNDSKSRISRSRSPENWNRRLDNKRLSRSSSKSSIMPDQKGRSSMRASSPKEDLSFDRTSRSSNRRGSLSLRRNFHRSPARYSREHSPPLNITRTRLLGRTPPSPPMRASKSSDRGRAKSPSNTPSRSKNRMSRSKSYESRLSPRESIRRGRESTSVSSAPSSQARQKHKVESKRGKNKSISSSPSSSRSSSSARTPPARVRKGLNSRSVSPEGPNDIDSRSRHVDKSRAKQIHRKSPAKHSITPEPQKQKKLVQKRRSCSSESNAALKKKAYTRPRGGPRSPSGSPGPQVHEKHNQRPLSREMSQQNRSPSSKSRGSDDHSSGSGSRPKSTGRKTPLAYQHQRESLSPPRKQYRYSKSPVVKSSHHSFSPRPHGKIHAERRNRERECASKYSHCAASPQFSISEKFKKDYRHSPLYQEHRSRYYRSPPPPPLPLDHRHYGMMEDEIAMRIERSRPTYYDEGRVEPRGSGGYYRRGEYLPEPERGYYRRASPLHLPPPPQPSYAYRRIPEVQYHRTGRMRGEEIDNFYRPTEVYRTRIRNPPVIYRSENSHSRQRPYRR